MTDQQVNHLALWERVEKTDPAFTKEYSGAGGFSGTAINATYLVKKATEEFGSLGLGWGYEIIEERYDTGGPLYSGGSMITDESGAAVRAMVHTIKLRLWYIDPASGERCTLEHYGHTPYVFANKYGVQTDQEAGKKSLTDAIKKCLSMLGFAGDIFMGMYDDIHYREAVGADFAIERAEDKIDAKEKRDAEYREWLAKTLEQIETAVNMTMLEAVYKSAMRKVSLRNDQKTLQELEKAKDKRKAELEEKAKTVKPARNKAGGKQQAPEAATEQGENQQ